MTIWNAVDLVLRDTSLLSTIMGFCREEEESFDPNEYYQLYVYDYRAESQHSLRPFTLVSRHFREVTIPLLFAEVSIETFSRYHPRMAPDISWGGKFSFYQSCAREIHFPSVATLYVHMPFLLDQLDRIQLRYLIYSNEDSVVASLSVTVDLRKKIVHLWTRAFLDKDLKVHINDVDKHQELGTERWPRGFQVIRNIHLNGENEDRDNEDSVVKVVSLDSILHPIEDDISTEESPRDEDRICALVYTSTNINIISLFLQHPFLKKIKLDAPHFSCDDIILILRKENLTELCFTTIVPNQPPKLTGTEVFRVLQEFLKSSVQRLDWRLAINIESLEELRRISISAENNVMGDSTVVARVGFFDEDSSRGWRLHRAYSDAFEAIFPMWTWVDFYQSPRQTQLRLVVTFTESNDARNKAEQPQQD